MNLRTVAKWAVALLALAVVGAGCTRTKEQARQAGSEPHAILSTQSAPGSAFILSLAMVPPQPKFAKKTVFRVSIKESFGKPVNGAQAQASLVMPLMDMGKNEFPLKQVGNGEYEGTGEFSMAGEWEVIVTASAAGRSGKTTFNVKVEE